MILAGWADGYRNNTFRTFEALTCPEATDHRPVVARLDDTCLPGPNHDLLPEHLKWWDHWLKGVDNGVESRTTDRGLRAAVDVARRPIAPRSAGPGGTSPRGPPSA